jgi:hypothetical protein
MILDDSRAQVWVCVGVQRKRATQTLCLSARLEVSHHLIESLPFGSGLSSHLLMFTAIFNIRDATDDSLHARYRTQGKDSAIRCFSFPESVSLLACSAKCIWCGVMG